MLIFKNVTSIFLALFLSLMLSVPAQAGTPCTPENGRVTVSVGGKCGSIQLAIDQADGVNPLVIDVMPGTYSESLSITNGLIHLRGAGKDLTTIMNLNTADTAISITNVSNVKVTGFTLSSSLGGVAADGFNVLGSTSIWIEDNNLLNFSRKSGVNVTNSSIVIKDNLIDSSDALNTVSGGVWLYNSTSANNLPVLITGNTISNFVTGLTGGNGGITVTGNAASTLVISHNVVIDTDGGAIVVEGYGNYEIHHNTVTDFEQGIWVHLNDNSYAMVSGNTVTGGSYSSYGSVSLHTSLGASIIFKDNIVTGSNDSGVTVRRNYGTMEIDFNTITGSADEGLWLDNNGGTLSVDGNTVTGNGTYDIDAGPVSAKASLNIYDSIFGGSGLVGGCNTHSDGTPW